MPSGKAVLSLLDEKNYFPLMQCADLFMLVMAIDHMRDLVHISALTQDPLDLKTTTFSLFATRWITHLCAPTFVFLSGVSALHRVFKFKRSEK